MLVGSHPSHGGGGVARGGRTKTCFSPRRRWMTLHPPSMFVTVASLRCPVAWRLHEMLVCSALLLRP